MNFPHAAHCSSWGRRAWSLLAFLCFFLRAPLVQAQGGTVTLSGHVYCVCDGGPVSGANVQVGRASAATDANGFYSFSGVTPGAYTAIVSGTNYATLTTGLTVTGGVAASTKNFSLTNTTVVINALFDPSITSDTQAEAITNSILSTVRAYRTLLANPVCVTILFQEVSEGLGESETVYGTIAYSKYLADLRANPKMSANDTNALAHMPAGPGTGLNGNTEVVLSPANLAAIGETDMAASLFNANGELDCTIGLNISIMNITRSNINPYNFDMQSTVLHEVDEALGIGGSGSALYIDGYFTAGLQPPTTGAGPLDFFRYRTPGVFSFTYDPNVSAYFSIDGGRTVLVSFNQSGNGADYGDWGDGVVPPDDQGNSPPQVQDAFGSPGEYVNLGVNELIALDVVGYNLTPEGLATLGQASTPAPSLAIAVASGQVSVSWPLAAGFGLFTSPGLGPLASWTLVLSDTFTTNQGTVVHSTTPTAPGAFFRLQQQSGN